MTTFRLLTGMIILLYQMGHPVTASDDETKLVRRLMEDYEILERPVLDDSKTVLVTLGIIIQQIIEIEEKNQLMLTNMWLKYGWNDYRLSWEPSAYGGITEIRVPFGKLWKPDVLLMNSLNDNIDSQFPVNFIVRSNGDVEWIPPALIKSTCNIDITWIPFDRQKCLLSFMSWTYSSSFIELATGDVDNSTYLESEEWALLDIVPERMAHKYECCDEPYYEVRFTLLLKRKTQYMGINFIIPCLLISLMALLEFILPPECGEKLTLGISIFMSLYVFLQMIGAALPPTSDAVPLIGTYFSCVTIIVSMSQVTTVLVLNLQHRNPNTYKMSPRMRKIFLDWLPWLLMMNRPSYISTRQGLIRQARTSEEQEQKASTAGNFFASNGTANANQGFSRDETLDIQTLQTPLEPLTISGLLQLPSPNDSLYSCSSFATDVAFGGTLRSRGLSLASTQDSTRPKISLPRRTPPLVCEQCNWSIEKLSSAVQELLQSVAKEVSFISKQLREEDVEKSCLDDWKYAARVLDRLCLIIFSAVLVSYTLATMFASPELNI